MKFTITRFTKDCSSSGVLASRTHQPSHARAGLDAAQVAPVSINSCSWRRKKDLLATPAAGVGVEDAESGCWDGRMERDFVGVAPVRLRLSVDILASPDA